MVFNNGKISELYQVCLQLDQDNLDRELTGLIEAMNFFNLKKGIIVTHDQTDSFNVNGKIISAIPFYIWATKV